MTGTTRIAVAGATGRVGRHVVEALRERGHEVVPISRSHGVDVTTGEGLAGALAGVEAVVDAATGASPDRDAATAFFLAAARNLQEAGARAGVRRMVVASIVGVDRLSGGYGAAKREHERAMPAGPVPARILRATQFHEFVDQLLGWGRRGDAAHLPPFRTQPVAARAVAEVLAEMALADDGPGMVEVAGPREERLAELARLLAARRGDPVRVLEAADPADPDHRLMEAGALLPGPDAITAGPSFAEWLEAEVPAAQAAPNRATSSAA